MSHPSHLSQREEIPQWSLALRFLTQNENWTRLSPPSRVSYTPRPRSSFKKATRCPGIANVGSDRSTNSLTRAVTRSCLGVGTESAASGTPDPEHQLRLEIKTLMSSSRLFSRNHARTCLRPCDATPAHVPKVTERWYLT